MDYAILINWTSPFFICGVSGVLVILILFLIEIPVRNSVDPDQMPHSAASDLVLHCLPLSHFWDARRKWVN